MAARDEIHRKYFAGAETNNVGTCPDMCPEMERMTREDTNEISIFEKYPVKALINKSVSDTVNKKEQLRHELRPQAVLERAIDHIADNVLPLCDDEKTDIFDWFDFVCDRILGIHKDIEQQILCPGMILVVEQCIRCLIFCIGRLIMDAVSLNNINMAPLRKCLESVLAMYDILEDTTRQNEAEFFAYKLLLDENEPKIFSMLEAHK